MFKSGLFYWSGQNGATLVLGKTLNEEKHI